MKYTEEHAWLREEDGLIAVGISEHASALLGTIIFLELPEEGTTVAQDDEVVVIEGDEAASDVMAPIDGEIVEVNTTLPDAPERVNEDPTGEGWFFRMKPSDPAQLDEFMDEAAYARFIA